jgi:hypothetical protein
MLWFCPAFWDIQGLHTHSQFYYGTFIFDKNNFCFDGVLFYYKSDVIYFMLKYYVKYETCKGDVLL